MLAEEGFEVGDGHGWLDFSVVFDGVHAGGVVCGP